MSKEPSDVLSLVRTLLAKGYPKAWQKLWENMHSLSQELRINVNASLQVFKLIYECISKEEEGRPVSTGFLVGNPERIKEHLPDSTGIDLGRKHISEMPEIIRRLFGLIDGSASVFVVGNDGMLEGSKMLRCAGNISDEIECPLYEFSTYCSTTRESSTYGIMAFGPWKVSKLYSNGMLRAEVYFSGKTGEWTYRSISQVLEKLNEISSRKGVDSRILRRIFGIAIQMSNHRKGGTLIIGNHNSILDQSEPPRLKLTGIKLTDFKGIQERHLYNLATQEFALVISREGELKGSSVRLLPKLPPEVKVEVTPTDGGRHRSAAEISASTDAISFVVSDDGPITIYTEGKRIVRV